MPGTVVVDQPQQSGSPFGALKNDQFRWLYGSNLMFFFAMNGLMIVRSILAYDLTGSELALGAVNLMIAVPLLLVSPFGGVIADRVERRKLILAGQSLLLVNETVVLVLLLTDRLEFWQLMVAVFFMGCTFPFIMPARQAIVANIVGRQGLGSAMALQMGGMNAMRVVAPVAAGGLAAVMGVNWVYTAAVVMYVLALVAVARIQKSPPAPDAGSKPVLRELAAGVKFVSTEPTIRALMVLSVVPILLAMPFQALLVVFAEDIWKVGDGGLGILQAFAGLGGIVGSLYVAFAGGTRHKLRLMMSSLFAFAGTLFLFALSPWFILALPFVLVADVFASIFTTTNGTLIQVLIPDEVRGRVMSLMMMTFGLTPLGTLPVSAVAEVYGVRVAVAGASVVTALLALAILLASGALRRIDATSKAALEEDDARPRFTHGAVPPAGAPGVAPAPTTSS